MKASSRFPRPVVVVSRCLCGVRCRWDGDSSPSDLVKALKQYARVIPVCPEMEIGLGVPRDRIVLVRLGQGLELYQPTSGLRLAQKMSSFTHAFLARCGEIDGFILKHKSPSCGLRGVKVYDSTAPGAAFVRTGVGLFAAEAMRQFPHAVLEDEERLNDPELREHYLTRLFTLAAWHAARKRGRAVSLQRFHEYHRLLLGIGRSRLTSEMDRLCANFTAADSSSINTHGTVPGRRPHLPTSETGTPPNGWAVPGTPPNGWVKNKRQESHPLGGVSDRTFELPNKLADQYEALLDRALQKPPRRAVVIAPFELALGHYASFLSPSDRSRFRRQMKLCGEHKLPLAELRKTVQIWAVRYDKNFIRRHSFFRPYPGPLADV